MRSYKRNVVTCSVARAARTSRRSAAQTQTSAAFVFVKTEAHTKGHQSFGSFDKFLELFNDAGLKQFGSGWVWLVRHADRRVEIISTPNQDSPFMQGLYPIMGNDVWEHAYYLKYNNRRADYLKAWWNVVNWAEVNKRFEESERALKKAVA